MNYNVELTITQSCAKLRNLDQKAVEIEEKLQKLSKEIENIKRSISNEISRIEAVGAKEPSRNPDKPDSLETTRLKQTFNEKLNLEKRELINRLLPEEERKSSSIKNISFFD